jgi:hypothetical protein
VPLGDTLLGLAQIALRLLVRRAHLDTIGFLLIAGIVFYQSMLPPVVSLGNNGDFGKVLGHFSLGSPVQFQHDFAPVKFRFDPSFTYHAAFRSSEIALAAAAIGLSSVWSKTGEVDIRTVGIIHGGIFLLAVYLLIPVLGHFAGPKTRFMILVAIAATFCDVMYVSVFNSFYMDASALVFLLLTVVLFLRILLWQRPVDLVGFTIASLFLVTAKPQHVAVVIPLSILIVCYRNLCPLAAAPWIAVVVLTAAASWTVISAPPDYVQYSMYDVIFAGLLPDSPSPPDEMQEFGLERADARFTGSTAYWPTGGFSDAAFVARFGERVHPRVLISYYLRHPARAYKLLLRDLDDAGNMRPVNGNFDPGEGFPRGAKSHAFEQWSALRKLWFLNHGRRYLWFTIGIAGMLLLRAGLSSFRSRWFPAAGCLVMALAVEMSITSFADATEAARHFTIFSALLDVCLLVLLASLLPHQRAKLEHRPG